MGYLTRYSLTYRADQELDLTDPIRFFRHKDEDVRYYLDPSGAAADSVKWYDHETSMLWLSAQFPKHLFTLHGEGEESGDIWNKHFKNGKMQVCKSEITYPPFDESKLEASE